MTYFTKLVGSALVALMLESPASARQWWLMEGLERAAPRGAITKDEQAGLDGFAKAMENSRHSLTACQILPTLSPFASPGFLSSA